MLNVAQLMSGFGGVSLVMVPLQATDEEGGRRIDAKTSLRPDRELAACGGIVMGIREQLGIPAKFVGVGEMPDDVEPFDPVRFVDGMFAQR